MPDFLTLYAEFQPDKLAVVDDRPNGEVISLSFAELNERSAGNISCSFTSW